MTGAGIFDGELLVVDRSIDPVHGQVVVAIIKNDLTVKRLYKKAGELILQALDRQVVFDNCHHNLSVHRIN